jgi:hypothetical protein
MNFCAYAVLLNIKLYGTDSKHYCEELIEILFKVLALTYD